MNTSSRDAARAGVMDRDAGREIATNSANYKKPNDSIKQSFEPKMSLADRRMCQQMRKAAEFLEKRDLDNCRIAIVVALEWASVAPRRQEVGQ
jgi:hypothetical protein